MKGRLTRGEFDFVFLSDRLIRAKEMKSFVDHVRNFTPSHKVVIIWGTDIPVPKREFQEFSRVSDWLFSREMYD